MSIGWSEGHQGTRPNLDFLRLRRCELKEVCRRTIWCVFHVLASSTTSQTTLRATVHTMPMRRTAPAWVPGACPWRINNCAEKGLSAENEDLDVRWLLLIHAAMRRGVVVDPVFLFIGHAVATGHLAGGTGFVVVAGQRPVTEGVRYRRRWDWSMIISTAIARPQIQLLHLES